MSAARYALDASGLIAMLDGEPGAELVEARIEACAMSTVNWCEAHERAATKGLDVAELRDDMLAFGLDLVPFSVADAERAASLRASTRHLGLSLADRACLALAGRLDVPALTADRAWLDLDVGVRVEAIR